MGTLPSQMFADEREPYNYAEAGVKILKELVFSRTKAYNMVQMFHFVVDAMDN